MIYGQDLNLDVLNMLLRQGFEIDFIDLSQIYLRSTKIENLIKEYRINILILKYVKEDRWTVGEKFQNVLSLIKPSDGSTLCMILRAW